MDSQWKLELKKKKKKKSPCLCTLSAYETNQVQSRERKIYNLHSTRQGGRIGDAIGSCASLEFLRTGKLLGNDPVASAHHYRCSPVASPLTSPASYGTQVDISSSGVFWAPGVHFIPTTAVESLISFWPRGFWSGEITTCRRKRYREKWAVPVDCPPLHSKVIYKHHRFHVQHYQQLRWKKTYWNLLPLRQSLLMSPADLTGDLPCE